MESITRDNAQNKKEMDFFTRVSIVNKQMRPINQHVGVSARTDKYGIDVHRDVLIVSFTFLLVRLLLASLIDAGFDEAVYFAYSLRPSLSYFDHPPMVAIWAGLVPWMTGIVSPLTIRLPTILLFSGAGILLYSLATRWLDRQKALLALIVFNSVPLLFICGGLFVLPDSGLAFFWIAALLVFARIIFDQDHRWQTWALAGLCIGLAMLAKYHGVFLAVFLLIYLFIEQPYVFRSVKTYLAGLVAVMTFLPVIVWNFQHDFASITYQGQRALGHGLNIDDFLQAIAGQAGYLTPMVFFPMFYVVWQTMHKGILGKDREYRFYFFFGSLPVLFFLGISLMKPILPHWTLPGYIVLTIPLAKLIGDAFHEKTWVRNTVIGSGVFIGVLLVFAVAHIRFGVLHLEKLVEKGIISQSAFFDDPTLDMVGWDEVNNYVVSNAINPDTTFLFTPHFLISGKVDLSTRGRYPVMCFNEHCRAYAEWDKQLDMRGKDAIYICTNRYFEDPQKKFAPYFESISDPVMVSVSRGGVPSKIFYFYTCKNLRQPFPSKF